MDFFYTEGNHLPHWKNSDYIDFPIDLGGIDSGRDYLYAPVDMVIVKINGINDKNVSNKIFLESIKKVNTPKFGKVKIFMTAVHFEDSDMDKYQLYEGKIIKTGEIICSEGKETATANHLHITYGIGSTNKSIQNNNGKWVTLGECKKPEDIFFIDNNFTIVKNSRDIKFKSLPEKEIIKYIGVPVLRDLDKNQIEVLTDKVVFRSDFKTDSTSLGFLNKGIYDYYDVVAVDNSDWYKIGVGWVYYTVDDILVTVKRVIVKNDNSVEYVKYLFCKKIIEKIKSFLKGIVNRFFI